MFDRIHINTKYKSPLLHNYALLKNKQNFHCFCSIQNTDNRICFSNQTIWHIKKTDIEHILKPKPSVTKTQPPVIRTKIPVTEYTERRHQLYIMIADYCHIQKNRETKTISKAQRQPA